MRLATLVCALAIVTCLGAFAAETPLSYGPGSRLCEVDHIDIVESSGLACSRRARGVFWTHNDSGDRPRLYAFSRDGHLRATCTVENAIALDWEDVASFTFKGKPYLLVADTGDNHHRRRYCTLYLVPEPRLDLKRRDVDSVVRMVLDVEFTYDKGPQDCEALAPLPSGKHALAITKSGKKARVYAVPLRQNKRDQPWVVKTVATLKTPAVTAMDISPDGRRVIVLTYRDAREYARGPDEAWTDAFARKPRIIALPKRQQGESICYGPDGKTLYLTSEGKPMPLFEVPLAAPDTP